MFSVALIAAFSVMSPGVLLAYSLSIRAVLPLTRNVLASVIGLIAGQVATAGLSVYVPVSDAWPRT